MKKKRRRKQKQKQRNIRRAKKSNARKKRNKQNKKNNSNLNSFNYDSIGNKPKNLRTPTQSQPKRKRNFLEDLFNFLDPFDGDDFYDFPSEQFFNDNSYPSSSYHYDEELFLSKMKEYADKSWKRAKFVEYDTNTVDYNNMSDGQLHFYFYWRDQARKGNFIPASYNYYFLYFIELLNIVGVRSTDEALEKLNELYLKLLEENDYFYLTERGISIFADRIFDFAYFHNLDLNKIYPEVWRNLEPRERIITALELFNENKNLILPPDLIIGISDFDLKDKSQIFRDNSEFYKEALVNLFYVLDFTAKKQFNKSLFDLGKFNYKSRSILIFDAYEHATVDADTFEAKSLQSNINFYQFRDYINGIIQEVENSLRSVFGQRGKLRKFDADEWSKGIINSFISEKFSPDLKDTPTGSLKLAEEYLQSMYSERKIEIDSSRLDELRMETEVVQELMDTSSYEEENEEDHLIYVDSLVQVLSSLVKASPDSLELLSNLVQSDNETINSIDMLNNKENILNVAKRFLNHPLIIESENEISLNKEYYNGVKYIFENKSDYPFLNVQSQSTETVNEEVLDFLDNLEETQLEFLRIVIKESNPQPLLEELAISAMSMVELIFDEINNLALLYLDDIILEMDENNVPYIIEEYNELIMNELEKET